MHKGWSKDWSGSAGCQTIPPDDAEKFFKLFTDGEQVQVTVHPLGSEAAPGHGRSEPPSRRDSPKIPQASYKTKFIGCFRFFPSLLRLR